MKNRVITVRVPSLLQRLLSKEENKSAKVQDALEGNLFQSGKKPSSKELCCPICCRPWPKEGDSKIEKDERISFKVDDDMEKRLENIKNMSAYVTVALSEEYGLCPACGNKKAA